MIGDSRVRPELSTQLPDDLLPVSVNDHLVEPRDMWDDMPRHVRARAPRLVETADGGHAWRFGERQFPFRTIGISAGQEIVRRSASYDEVPKGATDPHARLAAMDEDGVHVQTIFPMYIGFAGELLTYLGDEATSTAAARHYNDFVVSFCATDPERLVPIAILPLLDEEAALTELSRMHRAGCRGIGFPIAPSRSGLPSLHSGRWDRVFAAATSAGLPVFMHIGGMDAPFVPSDSPFGVALTAANFDALDAVAELAYSPVLLDNPDLQVVMVEANATFLPYMEERSDFFWDRHRKASHGPRTSAHTPPSELLRRQVSGTFITDSVAMHLIPHIGIERMMWQTDYPHADSLWPRSLEAVAATMTHLGDDEIRQLLELNARRVLQLDRPRTA